MTQKPPSKLDMANLTIASLLTSLKTAKHLLLKAQEFADANRVKDETILGLRLIADMFPFSRQIQIVTDNAKGAMARLSDGTAPVFADDETTIAQLIARVDKTVDYVLSVDGSKLIGTEEKEIVLKFGDLVFPFVGFTYVVGYLIPNINFHLTTAYDILRSNGVKIGKTDYLVA
jgi:uncharacterized protein